MALYEQFQKERGTPTGGLYAQFLNDRNAPPKVSFLDRIKNYANESASTVSTFNKAVASPWQTIQKSPEPFMKPYMAGISKAGEGLYDIVAEPGVAKKVAGTAKLISGLAESAFSPITGLFHLAENVPGLKQVADTINIPFTATGFAGSWATGKAIDWIPEALLSKESKDIIKQPLQEVGSLAGQIVLGGKIMRAIEVKAREGKVITPEEARKIVAESKGEVISSSQKSLFDEYKQETTKKTILPPTRTFQPTMTREVLGNEQIINTRAKDLIESAVEKKLIEAVDTGELPTHTRMDMGSQAKGAMDLIDKEPIKALDIAMGRQPSSPGILPESVYTALEIKAIKDGNIDLMMQLKNSDIPTFAGQALKALDSADPYSPVKIMRDVSKAREAKVEKVTKTKPTVAKANVVKEIKEKIPKVTRQSWSDFLEEIKCNY